MTIPVQYGGRGTHPCRAVHRRRGDPRRWCSRRRPLGDRAPDRSTADQARQRGSAPTVPAAHRRGTDRLLPGHERAQQRVGSRLGADRREANRRRLAGHRSEDLDGQRAPRRLHARVVPDQPGVRSPRGPEPADHRPPGAGRRRPSDSGRDRRRPLRGGVLRRGVRSRRGRTGRDRSGMDAGDRGAGVRAGRL